MACCTRYCAAEAHFGKKVAKEDLERYRRQGADTVTKLLLAELRHRKLKDKQLLDIGGGIGRCERGTPPSNEDQPTHVRLFPSGELICITATSK